MWSKKFKFELTWHKTRERDNERTRPDSSVSLTQHTIPFHSISYGRHTLTTTTTVRSKWVMYQVCVESALKLSKIGENITTFLPTTTQKRKQKQKRHPHHLPFTFTLLHGHVKVHAYPRKGRKNEWFNGKRNNKQVCRIEFIEGIHIGQTHLLSLAELESIESNHQTSRMWRTAVGDSTANKTSKPTSNTIEWIEHIIDNISHHIYVPPTELLTYLNKRIFLCVRNVQFVPLCHLWWCRVVVVAINIVVVVVT